MNFETFEAFMERHGWPVCLIGVITWVFIKYVIPGIRYWYQSTRDDARAASEQIDELTKVMGQMASGLSEHTAAINFMKLEMAKLNDRNLELITVTKTQNELFKKAFKLYEENARKDN